MIEEHFTPIFLIICLIIFLFYRRADKKIPFIFTRKGPVLVTPPPPTGIVSGTALTQADGKPVADATANLVNPEDGSIADTQATDANGAFAFKAVAIGKYHIQVVGTKNPDGTWFQGDMDIDLEQATLTVSVPMVCLFV